MRRIVGWGVVLLLLLSVPVSVLSQVSTIVRGTVTDSTGGVIPGASVTVVHETTDEATTRLTDEIGNYEFTGLPPGIYTLTADMPGFEVGTYSNVELAAGQEVLRNFTLDGRNRELRVHRFAPRDLHTNGGYARLLSGHLQQCGTGGWPRGSAEFHP